MDFALTDEQQTGRTAAPVPLLGGLAMGALAIARHGSPGQQAALLPGIARGELLVTAALVEPLGDELTPATTARSEGEDWVLDGTKTCVPAGLFADRVVVSATTPDGPALFLVDPGAVGVTRERQDTIAWTPEALLVLDGVPGELLGGDPAGGRWTTSCRWPRRRPARSWSARRRRPCA